MKILRNFIEIHSDVTAAEIFGFKNLGKKILFMTLEGIVFTFAVLALEILLLKIKYQKYSPISLSE